MPSTLPENQVRNSTLFPGPVFGVHRKFNDEISWLAKVKKPTGIEFKEGDAIFLPQIETVESVQPPSIDGERVAFVFLYWTGKDWNIIFDSTPNFPDEQTDSVDSGEWQLGRAIAESINIGFRENAITFHDSVEGDVKAIGLWAAPSLLPYPLSAITEKIKTGNQTAARELLVSHCTVQFIKAFSEKWKSLPAFAARQKLFDDAIEAHDKRLFTLSIGALVPHIEGVVTDWIISKVPNKEVPFRQESKTQKFRDILMAGAQRTFTDQRVGESVVDFILNGPLLESFTDWLSPPQTCFPNRHLVGHGKYEEGHYSEENSIKVFLLLDTLFQIMNQHVDHL